MGLQHNKEKGKKQQTNKQIKINKSIRNKRKQKSKRTIQLDGNDTTKKSRRTKEPIKEAKARGNNERRKNLQSNQKRIGVAH